MTRPLIRLWDRDWNLVAVIESPCEAFGADGDWRRFIVAADHQAAKQLDDKREALNVTIDTDEQRWHGVVERWEFHSEPCPTCKHGSQRSMTISCEPAALVPVRVLNYDNPFASAQQPNA